MAPNRADPARRAVYRRRRATVAAGLVLVLGASFYLPFTLLAPVHTVAAQTRAWTAPPASQPSIAFPAYGASAVGALGYGGVLASAGPTTPLPIASIAKVITALVVLSVKPLGVNDVGPKIVFGPADVQFYAEQVAENGIVEPVTAGDSVTQRTMMTVMLMASANNYADSLANWAFGSKSAYVTAARAWLAARGLAGTTVVDPTGISPSNAATVADLVELARLAVADPFIAKIAATTSVDLPGIGTVTNRNELLGIDGVTGIKTGTLDESGACLLFSATVTIGTTPVTLVGAVLSGPDHSSVDAAVRTLLARTRAGFRDVTFTPAGQSFATYSTDWGETADAVAGTSSSMLLWQNTPITASVRADPLKLAVAGTQVGVVTFTAGTKTVTVPLVLSRTIDDPGVLWRLTNPTRLF